MVSTVSQGEAQSSPIYSFYHEEVLTSIISATPIHYIYCEDEGNYIYLPMIALINNTSTKEWLNAKNRYNARLLKADIDTIMALKVYKNFSSKLSHSNAKMEQLSQRYFSAENFMFSLNSGVF